MRQFQCLRALVLAFVYLLPALLAVRGVSPAFAQAPFYQGKTITLIIGAGPGGMGDLRAKALASVLAKQIPGNPTITFQYMPGGGGRTAANRLYTNTRPDGLTLFRISSSIMPYAVLGSQAFNTISTSSFTSAPPNTCSTISSTPAPKRVSILWQNSVPPRESASAALRWATPGTSTAA